MRSRCAGKQLEFSFLQGKTIHFEISFLEEEVKIENIGIDHQHPGRKCQYYPVSKPDTDQENDGRHKSNYCQPVRHDLGTHTSRNETADRDYEMGYPTSCSAANFSTARSIFYNCPTHSDQRNWIGPFGYCSL